MKGMVMMNSSGWVRGYMSKSYSGEDFLIHVGTTIERQLKEWDEGYEVNIMKFRDYVFVVKKGDRYYEMKLAEKEVEMLKDKSPYSLDRRIWVELERQVIQFLEGYGNYVGRVL
ncbi:hypothetical protein CIL05_18875 [Virgibacillus profundi]|uniref:Uncharacterized protein n=1 Tax=Virgibacillus profundi TaxID=2024555 RepID=A0A2A2I997_9BACI|nr:hypothetical protein [Virgibacillus profundi]PAV27938.1 hypothetical protein CIL05_18875 [Virgibacillus profundi]PXY52116.1 hypothetical protein CIT14_18970 [Virgibacillus profundi]